MISILVLVSDFELYGWDKSTLKQMCFAVKIPIANMCTWIYMTYLFKLILAWHVSHNHGRNVYSWLKRLTTLHSAKNKNKPVLASHAPKWENERTHSCTHTLFCDVAKLVAKQQLAAQNHNVIVLCT